jgi:CheY-like chemotaxis protein
MNQTSLRILVVDDSADTARMMAVLLKAEGHTTRTALDGPEALQLAQDLRPDVVLLDLSLPGMSGVEVAETLRRTEGLQTTTLVALSGHAADQTPNLFDARFTKPVDHDALNAFLSRLARKP